MWRRAGVVAVLAIAACSSDDPSSGGTGASSSSSGGSSSSSGSASSSGSTGSSPPSSGCDQVLLHTGITAQQTGVSADAFDCEIEAATAKFSEPDPMIFKAIMYLESRFDNTSAACPNLPCGTPTGWTVDECGCYGLMQIVPACNKPGDPGMLPSGHPNLTKDTSSPDWAGSVYNPVVNIELGIGGVAGNRAQEVKKFPGCTVDQYTMMAIGDYGSYGSTKSCTEVNHDYLDNLIKTYNEYAAAARYAAHPY